jgi:hypothetical protein
VSDDALVRRIRTTILIPITLLLGLLGAPQVEAANDEPIEVTRGELFRLAGIQPVPPGTAMRIHFDGDDKTGFLVDDVPIASMSARVGGDGTVVVEHAIPLDSVVRDRTDAIEANECVDPAFLPLGDTWDQSQMPIAWRFNARTVPKRLHRSAVLRDIKRAHAVWPRAKSACPQKSDSSLAFVYAGRTRTGTRLNGINVVEIGRLGPGVIAATFHWLDEGRIMDSDIRLARGAGWTTISPVQPKRNFLAAAGTRSVDSFSGRGGSRNRYRRYIVANVLAHEIGNQIGLEDLEDPHGDLTMYGLIARGETEKLSLGAGDVFGAWLLNP